MNPYKQILETNGGYTERNLKRLPNLFLTLFVCGERAPAAAATPATTVDDDAVNNCQDGNEDDEGGNYCVVNRMHIAWVSNLQRLPIDIGAAGRLFP